MSSNTSDQVQWIGPSILDELFNLFGDVTASTTPARLVGILTRQPPSRSLPLALTSAAIGFAECFPHLLPKLVRFLKVTLSYDRIKLLRINDAEEGSRSFVSLFEHDFADGVKAAYRSGALKFDLKDNNGMLNVNNPCFSAGFISATAILQNFTLAGQYHRVVALSCLGLHGPEDTAEELIPDAKEVFAVSALICFAVVGAPRYAQMLAGDGVTYESVRLGVKSLREGGVVRQVPAIALLDIVVADLTSKVRTGRSIDEVHTLIFGVGETL